MANGPTECLWPSPLGARAIRVRVPVLSVMVLPGARVGTLRAPPLRRAGAAGGGRGQRPRAASGRQQPGSKLGGVVVARGQLRREAPRRPPSLPLSPGGCQIRRPPQARHRRRTRTGALLPSVLLTQICDNTFECARTRDDRQNDQHSENLGRTGLTGFADWSDRFRRPV